MPDHYLAARPVNLDPAACQSKRNAVMASFKGDGAVLYLAIQKASEKWTMPIRDWKAALNRFATKFGDRCH
jgi:transposase-like protein